MKVKSLFLKMFSVICSLLIVAATAFSLSACNMSGNTKGMKIGLLQNYYNDTTNVSIAYLDYLIENFSTEEFPISYQKGNATNASGAENLIASGCNVIFAYYDSSIPAIEKICANSDVYLVVVANDTAGDASYSDYFLGGTNPCGADTSSLAQEIADIILSDAQSPADVNVSGMDCPENYMEEFSRVYAGIKSDITAAGGIAKELYTPSTFDVDGAKGVLANMNASSPYSNYIVGFMNALYYVYPLLGDNSSYPNIADAKVVSFGYDSTAKSKLQEDGTQLLAAGDTNMVAATASAFARAYNALKVGKNYSDFDKATNCNGASQYILATAETVEFYERYIQCYTNDRSSFSYLNNGDCEPCITADELKNVLLDYNPDATFADLNALTDKTLSQIIQDKTA